VREEVGPGLGVGKLRYWMKPRGEREVHREEIERKEEVEYRKLRGKVLR